MENGKIKVWMPAIRAGSGADVFTQRLAAALEFHGLAVTVSWFSKYDELLPLRLMRAVPPQGADVVLANSWNGYAFKRAGLPLIVTVHHAIFEPGLDVYKSAAQSLYHRFFAQPRESRSLHAADAITAVSSYVADRLKVTTGRCDVDVIHNWVDTARFHPAQTECRSDGTFRLLFVGKLSRLKGRDMLAPIMRELGSGFELQVTVDAGSYKAADCPDNMHPVGRLSEDDLIRAYQHCDAVLVPSQSEGFGYVALEAMACGKPVIASNNTALPETVQDGVTGILCNTGNVGEFVTACRLLKDNAELCRQMGNAGRWRATHHFSAEVLVESYLALIRRCKK